MSDPAHEWTDQELAKLEKRIAEVYKEAAEDMGKTAREYFEKFTQREAEQKKLIGTVVNGKEYTEEDFAQWRLTQEGRGKRFEAMRDKLAERATQANEVAMSYVNGDMAKIYAMNQGYTIEDAIKQTNGAIGTDWTIYNEDAVKRLVVEQPDLMPHYPESKAVERGIDLAYGKKQITKQVTQGILQGKSSKGIAASLMRNIPDMGRVSAVRAARTAVTEAENAGRQAAAEQLAEKGVVSQKRWRCTHDSRTRDWHAEADDQVVDMDEPFEVGGEQLMYPGDGSLGASGWNLYNCRCSRQLIVTGFKSILTEEQRKAANIRRVK